MIYIISKPIRMVELHFLKLKTESNDYQLKLTATCRQHSYINFVIFANFIFCLCIVIQWSFDN